ncbi:GAF domain-containing protein [Paenibacillus sp. TRM 82003]|uniref:GAF domain-containing protein n=1 Tax=Kineococcus sp. TRM81007 TaxID=2925831 RepID=UPI001F566BDF|nr:GAF domain-containing protein [Kineococcus sp. TRM81007]MCI2237846.1 GAF domain-containing protein [Kineococcus sp. TRM81007]MCI3924577.1 GAF domain-containing protein [Paenibacillus sp. TRM 82003]
MVTSHEDTHEDTHEDARTLAALSTLLDRVHLITPGQLPDALAEAAAQLGWSAVLYLVDYEQRVLVPAPAVGVSGRRVQGVDTTLAGRCFRTVEPMPWSSARGRGVWLPVLDGVDRLGVLEVGLPEGTDLDDALCIQRCRLLAHLAGHLIVAKGPYGEGLTRIRHRKPARWPRSCCGGCCRR